MKVALAFLLTLVVAASMELECPSPETEGLLPNPNDCKTFYICEGAVPTLMNCPVDLHFSPKFLRCEYPYVACCDSVYCDSAYCKKMPPCSPTSVTPNTTTSTTTEPGIVTVSTTTEPGVVTVITTTETEPVTGEESEEEDCS